MKAHAFGDLKEFRTICNSTLAASSLGSYSTLKYKIRIQYQQIYAIFGELTILLRYTVDSEPGESPSVRAVLLYLERPSGEWMGSLNRERHKLPVIPALDFHPLHFPWLPLTSSLQNSKRLQPYWPQVSPSRLTVWWVLHSFFWGGGCGGESLTGMEDWKHAFTREESLQPSILPSSGDRPRAQKRHKWQNWGAILKGGRRSLRFGGTLKMVSVGFPKFTHTPFWALSHYMNWLKSN